jgi:3-oxoacyl-[acyl-carrier protein] reductase
MIVVMDELTGKAVLVTGGSRGIGAAIAVRLAELGADVAVTYERDGAAAGKVVARIGECGRRGLAIRADSGDPAEVVAAVDRVAGSYGRLDVLVNNAGAFTLGPIEELTAADFDRTVAVNVRAPFLAARAAAKHLPDGGRIITIGSNVAERTPFPGFSLYALSKSALVGLTKGLARDLGPRGITVNLVSPGATDTEMNPADGPAAGTINGLIPLGRYAAPDEIAGAVAFLAGPAASYLTGTTVAVDGGITA